MKKLKNNRKENILKYKSNVGSVVCMINKIHDCGGNKYKVIQRTDTDVKLYCIRCGKTLEDIPIMRFVNLVSEKTIKASKIDTTKEILNSNILQKNRSVEDKVVPIIQLDSTVTHVEEKFESLIEPISSSNITRITNKTISSYERSEEVKSFALKRANGFCEYCGKLGFLKKDRTRYLEVHHLIPLSEGGEEADNVSNVVAICADCHREMHFGINGKEITKILMKKFKSC